MSVEEEANAVGDYWEGHPKPPEEPVTPEAQAEYSQQMAAWQGKFGPDGPPEPPEPPTVPGPPSPGAGMPAARIGDLCAHGGAVVGPGCPTVLIGGMPAVRAMPAMDTVACPMFKNYLPAPVTYSGLLSSFPVEASHDAEGVWDVVLDTALGASDWEGVPTRLIAGTITVSSA